MSKEFEQLGMHFLVALDGPTLLPAEARMLKSLKPLGIILFAKNFAQNDSAWQDQLKFLIEAAREASSREDLIVSVDHEGGRVHRFPPPVTHFPYARDWAKDAFAVGQKMGKELRALGFNLNFSPVLDVDLEPQNSVISKRSFACEVENVAAPAIEHMKGLHSQGVLSCGKHFPGHGATVADSHFELPTRDISLQELEACELLPFCQYLKHSPPLLMTAHVIYPQIDPHNPATTSSKIINELLRDKLNYQGAVISDDLEMKALNSLSEYQKATGCINAGVDILLEGSSQNELPLETAVKLASCLAQAIDKNEVKRETIEASRHRIKNLKESLKLISN
jgi:beta-N-acetylhexosaminidase